jgi:hypothetical protein
MASLLPEQGSSSLSQAHANLQVTLWEQLGA